MNEDDLHAIDRRRFALDKAVATALQSDRPNDIVARAEAFDTFLRGDKPSDSGT